MANLTERELEILKLRKAGKTQAEIAKALKISQPAVSSFDRNARKKIEEAQELLDTLKKLGLLVLALVFIPLTAQQAHAATPNPGHEASSVGAGTFSAGNFVFQNSLKVNGSLFNVVDTTSQVIVNSSSVGSFQVVNTTNRTHFYVNGSSGFIGIGRPNPSYSLDVNSSGISARFLSASTYAQINVIRDDVVAGGGSNQAKIGFGTTNDGVVWEIDSDVNTNGGNTFGLIYSGSSVRFIIDSGGRVGIGTKLPSEKLEVNASMRVFNGSNSTLLVVKSFNNGSARVGIGVSDPQNALSVNGTINASGTINQGAGLDIAEQFGTTESMSAGDIVAIVDRDNVKKSTQADASLTIGIVSTQPGFTMSKEGLTNPRFIALAGRVPVNIAGPVQKGDYITVSSTPGVGTVALEPSFVIGRALENSAGGSVFVLINPGYFSPRIDVSGNLIGGLANRKYEPARNEKLSDTAVAASAASPQGGVTNAQEIKTQDATVVGELLTDVIRPEQGKDVVVVIG